MIGENTLSHQAASTTILMADDDLDDQMFVADALKEANIKNKIDFVNDGIELIDYMNRAGQYKSLIGCPLPGIILLDLNMPRMDGYEAIKKLKEDIRFQRIPVVVMTTSDSEDDVAMTYELGVNSFIVKPVKLKCLTSVMAEIGKYWLKTVRLPNSVSV